MKGRDPEFFKKNFKEAKEIDYDDMRTATISSHEGRQCPQ